MPQLCQVGRAPSIPTLVALESALANFRISLSGPSTDIGRRYASHQTQGRANGAKQGPGKRLGAKKTGNEYVVPGNIIYKQRGTLWFPGDGCHMGRDHTIHAAVPGYVKFYRDPARHPKRKFIGVVFERHQTLPRPPNAVRRRMLGMLAYQMPTPPTTEGEADTAELTETPPDVAQVPLVNNNIPTDYPRERTIRERFNGRMVEKTYRLRPGYQWRESNWEIGRAALQSKKAQNVRPFDRGDRFLAWRKRTEKKAQRALQNSMKKGKASVKKSIANKKAQRN